MRISLLVPLVLALSGCKYFSPAPEREPDPVSVSVEPIVAECRVIEFDNLSRESPNPRVREDFGVSFDYAFSNKISASLTEKKPRRLFLLAHGWPLDPRNVFSRLFSKRGAA